MCWNWYNHVKIAMHSSYLSKNLTFVKVAFWIGFWIMVKGSAQRL